MMNDYDTYIALGISLKERIANALRQVIGMGTFEQLKAMGRFHGFSVQRVKQSAGHFQIACRIDLGGQFDDTIVIPTGYVTIRFSAEVLSKPQDEWPEFIARELLEQASKEAKGKAKRDYQQYLQLKQRFDKPEGVDWKAIDEVKGARSNRKKITSFKTK